MPLWATHTHAHTPSLPPSLPPSLLFSFHPPSYPPALSLSHPPSSPPPLPLSYTPSLRPLTLPYILALLERRLLQSRGLSKAIRATPLLCRVPRCPRCSHDVCVCAHTHTQTHAGTPTLPHFRCTFATTRDTYILSLSLSLSLSLTHTHTHTHSRALHQEQTRQGVDKHKQRCMCRQCLCLIGSPLNPKPCAGRAFLR
jgi:hypothetical protein